MTKSLILCDCSGSQEIDADGLSKATGLTVAKQCTALCTTQIETAAQALTDPDNIFCCTQEQRLFDALSEEVGGPVPACVDLRDRAGWSQDTRSKLPKMAALLAEATLPTPNSKSIDITSEGICLILGEAEVALAAAEKLKDQLGVTVLLSSPHELPFHRDFDVVVGKLRNATGALGGFNLRIDALQQMQPGGRGAFSLTEPRDGGRSQCDILLDLTGGPSLFPAPEKREGYLRADPGRPKAVAEAIFEASHLVGTFEKPLYVKTEPLLCAHSRASQTGCTNCLDVCPTGAITSAGDHVTVDPNICAGCGACSALCPSGAISYDAPPVDMMFRRVQTLAKAYVDAGGIAPRLLTVNAHGSEMIRLAARFGQGLPADVIPLEISALNAFGHAEIIAALAAGFADVSIVPSPSTDLDTLNREVALAQALSSPEAVTVIDTPDPDALTEALYAATPPAPCASPVRPMGNRRQITRQAAQALHGGEAHIPLPADAPYGAVLVDTDACSLCLSCVSLCPSGALGDNPDLPQLRFQEDACLQCGLCANICPEDAITYEPRMNLETTAFEQVVLNEEEPFACVECGSLFGAKSTIDTILGKLAGKHAMFLTTDAARMIQMCDDCRVNAQFHSEDSPFAGKERPRPRTSDDYFAKRRDH